MLTKLMRPFFRANDFLFVIEVSVFAVMLSGVLLLLLIGLARTVGMLWKAKQTADQKESSASSTQWAVKLFAKNTTIQLLWSTGAYVAFCLLNLDPVESRLFIIWANVVCSVATFAEGVRRLRHRHRELTNTAQGSGR